MKFQRKLLSTFIIIIQFFTLTFTKMVYVNTKLLLPETISLSVLNNSMIAIWHKDNTLRFYDELGNHNGTTINFNPLISPFYSPTNLQMKQFCNRKTMNHLIANVNNLICVFHYPSLSQCFIIPNVTEFKAIEFFNHSSFLIASHSINGYMIIDTQFNNTNRIILNNVSNSQKINDIYYDQTKNQLYAITQSGKIGVFDLNPSSISFMQMQFLPINLPNAGYYIFTLNYNSSIVGVCSNDSILLSNSSLNIYDSSINSYPLRKSISVPAPVLSSKQILDTFVVSFNNNNFTQYDQIFFQLIQQIYVGTNHMYIASDILLTYNSNPGLYIIFHSVGYQHHQIRKIQGMAECLKVNQNCTLCNLTYLSNKCLECKKLFSLEPTGVCTPLVCIQNCQLCNSTGFCFKCNQDYILYNNSCQMVYLSYLQVAGNVLSFPNLRQLVKPTKIIFMVLDDYQYYNFHNRQYSLTMSLVFQSIQFIGDIKLYPHIKILDSIQEKMNISKFDFNYSNYTPVSYQQKTSKDINFSKNTWQMYEMQYLPSIFTFMVCRMLYIMLVKFKRGWFTGFLRRFFWGKRLYKVLLVCFIQANISYISFHFGIQFLLPSSYETFGKLSIMIATLFFFGALLYSFCFYLVLFLTCHPLERQFFLTFTRNTFQGHIGEALVGNIRNLLNGFIHGYFIYNYQLQVLLLILIKCLVLGILFTLKFIYQRAIYDFLIKFYFTLGLILDLILLLQYKNYIDGTKWEGAEFLCLVGMFISTIVVFCVSIYNDLKETIIKLWQKIFSNKLTPEESLGHKVIERYVQSFVQVMKIKLKVFKILKNNKKLVGKKMKQIYEPIQLNQFVQQFKFNKQSDKIKQCNKRQQKCFIKAQKIQINDINEFEKQQKQTCHYKTNKQIAKTEKLKLSLTKTQKKVQNIFYFDDN